MAKINSFVLGFVMLSGNSSLLAQDVTFETNVFVPNMSSQAAGDPVCIDSTGLLVADCDAALGFEGPEGLEGPTGPVGISGYERVSASNTTGAGGVRVVTANCPGGKKVLGGGVNVTGYNFFPPYISQSYPLDADSWLVEVKNNELLVGITVTAWAVCATVAN